MTDRLIRTDNPFMAPSSDFPDEVRGHGVKSGKIRDVYNVAWAQKGMLLSLIGLVLAIGASLIAMPMEMANPESASIPSLVSALHIVSGLGGIIFTILLAIRVYRPILGIPLGLLAAIPLFGILIMLIVNGRATGLLRKNGFKVGLMGANLAVESGSYRRMNDESRDEED